MANRVTSEDILRMNEIYYKTHIFAEVARQTGFSASTVRKYVDKNWEPPKVEVKPFKWENLPSWSAALKIFEGIDNYGTLCILTEREQEKIKELWKELSI